MRSQNPYNALRAHRKKPLAIAAGGFLFAWEGQADLE
jgi:hypothetical protein